MSIDTLSKTVRVFELSTQTELVYGDITPREALALAVIQHSLGDYDTWCYDTKVRQLGEQVVLGHMGRTASLCYKARTYCVKVK